MSVLVLQHVAVEGPGRIARALDAAQCPWRAIRLDLGEALPSTLPPELEGLVVMGGPMGVYDAERYPFLRDELSLIRRAIAAELPILGVCLGSQLLASALEARVAPGPAKEIGWIPVALSDAATDDPLLAGAPAQFTPLQWHGDAFELPHGAVSLARSAITAHQAFRYGRSAWGLLFHLEADARQVEAMSRAFADELSSLGMDPAALVARSHTATAEIAGWAEQVFGRWVALATERRRH